MARGAPWSSEHIELLKKAVLEKGMSINDLAILFPSRTKGAIRAQLNRHDLASLPDDPCVPDMDFFNSYGTAKAPSLKVV